MQMTAEKVLDLTERAITLGVSGDLTAAGQELAPVIADSYGATYALAAMLAETASQIARRDQTGPFLDGGSAEDMPPDVAFAAQFTAAWANRDHDTCEDLFRALIKRSEPDGPDLVDGLLQLFSMAVATSTAVAEEQRAQRTTKTD